jgi:hypothetical protein
VATGGGCGLLLLVIGGEHVELWHRIAHDDVPIFIRLKKIATIEDCSANILMTLRCESPVIAIEPAKSAPSP